MLLFKFHTLGAQHEARLKAAMPEAIDRYLQSLLTADSLAAVFDPGKRTGGRPLRG